MYILEFIVGLPLSWCSKHARDISIYHRPIDLYKTPRIYRSSETLKDLGVDPGSNSVYIIIQWRSQDLYFEGAKPCIKGPSDKFLGAVKWETYPLPRESPELGALAYSNMWLALPLYTLKYLSFNGHYITDLGSISVHKIYLLTTLVQIVPLTAGKLVLILDQLLRIGGFLPPNHAVSNRSPVRWQACSDFGRSPQDLPPNHTGSNRSPDRRQARSDLGPAFV
ncbi:hypothetical protein M5689_007387 [Euphorbia peplus]|nr:hypothetical protein M5689_007387 [Euphorbia peplus]